MSRTTINVYGFPMEVAFDYYKAEAPVWWGDYPEPGCAACCDISSVKVGGVDIVEMLDAQQLARIETALVSELEAA